MDHVLLLALAIGFVAGLRSLTAPALVSWAAHLGWINLQGTPFAFMGTAAAVGIFSVLGLLELIGDVLPKTPPRTTAVPLIARAITGGLCGACMYAVAGAPAAVGAAMGILGALIGAFAGYRVRGRLVKALKVKDVLIAIPEDILAIALAYFIVRKI